MAHSWTPRNAGKAKLGQNWDDRDNDQQFDAPAFFMLNFLKAVRSHISGLIQTSPISLNKIEWEKRL